jgi:hypothetical protein
VEGFALEINLLKWKVKWFLADALIGKIAHRNILRAEGRDFCFVCCLEGKLEWW